jgi:hypothetical protein
METPKLWVTTEPRPLDRSRQRFVQLIALPQKPSVQNMVMIGWLGLSKNEGITTVVCVPFFIPFF